MLHLSFDFEALTMLASMSGVHLSSDHEKVYAAIEDLDRRGREKSRPIAMVYLVARDNVAPDAHWRRRFAEQRKTFGSPHVYLSIVSQSPVIRGVLTAMNWIAPQPRNMTSATHATFEESAAWIEHHQGTSRVALRALLNDAQSSARKSAGQRG
jgi:hypothetical protein